MSQPPPLPPNLPPQQPVPYASRQQQPHALPMAVQALLGTLATVGIMIGMCFFILGMSTAFVELGNRGFLILVGIVSLTFVAIGLLLARRLRRNPAVRGWAIGIYIGMGLSALFWGACGLLIVSLTNTNFH